MVASLSLMFLWGSCTHEIKCFPPAYLSYVNLIIRPAEEPGRKGGAAPPPFRLVTMPPRQCLLCAGPWPMYGQWKTGEPGPCLSPTRKGEGSVPLLLQQALEIIKYFKISVFHWELDQCERAVFFGCHCFHENTLNCLGKANAFESSQGPPLWVFLGSCLDSAGSMKCTFLVQVTTGHHIADTIAQAQGQSETRFRTRTVLYNNHRVLNCQALCPASFLGT